MKKQERATSYEVALFFVGESSDCSYLSGAERPVGDAHDSPFEAIRGG